MVQPIDYTVKTVDPTEAFTKTLGMYQGLEQNQQSIEANKLTIEAARQKIEADKAGQERLRQVGELVNKAVSPGATIDDVRNALVFASTPEQSNALKSIYETMDKTKKQNIVNANLPVYAALVNGQPGVAIPLLEQRRDAYANSGDTANAAKHSAWIDAIKADPKAADAVQVEMGALLAADSEFGAPGVEAVLKQRKAKPEFELATAQARREGALADTAVEQAKIAPAMAKLEQQSKAVGIQLDQARIKEIGNSIKVANENLKMAKEAAKGLGVKLPVATQALVNKVATDSVTNQQMGLNYIDFANRVAGSNVRGGFFGNANKFLEGIGGNPDLIRVEATKLINSDAMTGLPAGAASDKDVAMVREGYPNNANAATLAQFFRGTAKVKLIQAQTQSNTAEWLTMNGTLGPARAPMIVGGRQVKAGETFTKFNGSAAGEIIKNVDRQVARTTVQPAGKPTVKQPPTAAKSPKGVTVTSW